MADEWLGQTIKTPYTIIFNPLNTHNIMEKSKKLEVFLGMAQERIYNNATLKEEGYIIQTQRDEDSGELECIEISIEGAFYPTDLVTLAESLELSCYFTLSYDGLSIKFRVY